MIVATRLAARVLGAASVVLFAYWRLRQGIPAEGEAGHWEALVHMNLLGLVVAGNIVALRWEMTGATIMAVSGLGLAAVVGYQEPPGTTIPLALAFFVPPALHWLAWQRRRPLGQVAALAVVYLGLLTGSVVVSWQTFDAFYGPAHPSSPTAALPASPVSWVWSGGVTATSGTVRAELAPGADPTGARLVVATDADLGEQVATVAGRDAGAVAGTGEASRVASFAVDGLEPDTTYHYAVEVAGTLDRVRAGRFHTFPQGAASFRVAVGTCARMGSNGAVFDTIAAADPLLYLIGGDFFYADIGTNDRDAFRSAYRTTLSGPAQSALYRSVPVAYTWDDHDSGPNDADATSGARPAAQVVYRELVPHYELAVEGSQQPIHQAFTVGRVRFVLLDTRSARSPKDDPDGPAKTMLGAGQLAWLEEELTTAAATHPLVVLVTSVPWIGEATSGGDDWSGYSAERQTVADIISAAGLGDRLLMVAGDAHMVAIDDGTHSDYTSGSGEDTSTGGEDGTDTGDGVGGGFPVFHAGALDRAGSEKGGPYSEGAVPGAGHYGLIDVDDDGGDEITVRLRGLDWEDRELVAYTFSVPGEPRSG